MLPSQVKQIKADNASGRTGLVGGATEDVFMLWKSLGTARTWRVCWENLGSGNPNSHPC